jgi:multidrug efflux system outer membrane protein
MKRLSPLVALLAAGCMSMEPKYSRPEPVIPASWPVGDPYLHQAEIDLPALSYTQVFTSPKLQTLAAQALVNNQDLRAAAANIVAAREQYRIQRAEQLPELDAAAGTTITGERDQVTDKTRVSADYRAGVSVPSFELDLFGRLRSLSNVELNRYFASEAGARSTRLSLVSDVADAWANYGADQSLLLIAQETAASAEKSVRLTRLRLEGGIAPRTDLRQAEQVLTQAQADLARQRTALAQDVNLLQLLVGGPIDRALLPGTIDEAFGSIATVPAGLDSYVLLRRPDVLQSEYQLRAANAQIGAARAALFPRISLTGLAGVASSALASLFTGGAFGFSAGANASYAIFQGGAGRANVRLSEAQRTAAVASYQSTIQTAFREVADALARQGTMGEQLDALERRKAAAADNYLLNEARYRAGIDPYLTTLDAQRSYYIAQQQLVQAKLTAAQNRVDLYQSIGGDALLQSVPICQPLPSDNNASSAKVASQCSPM